MSQRADCQIKWKVVTELIEIMRTLQHISPSLMEVSYKSYGVTSGRQCKNCSQGQTKENNGIMNMQVVEINIYLFKFVFIPIVTSP